MAEACQNGLGGKTDETTPRKRPLCSRLCVGELVELFPRVVGGGLAVFRRERGTTVAAEVDAVAGVEGVYVVGDDVDGAVVPVWGKQAVAVLVLASHSVVG